RLERELRPELDAPHGRARGERADAPERGRAERAVRVPEVRAVEEVEDLGSQLHARGSEGDALHEREVGVRVVRATQDVAARVAEGELVGEREGRRVVA